MWAAVFTSLALAASAQGVPQTPGAAEPETSRLADVIVDGRRLEEAARAFVEEIGAPPPGTRPGRWNSEMCISVTGMQQRYAEYLIDRVAAVALDAGVEVMGPGCRPNVIILATDDGPALASQLVQARMGFRPADSSTNLTRTALNHFATSDAPVRWWHVTMPIEPDSGRAVADFRGSDGPPDSISAPIFRVRDASLVRSNIRYDIAWAIIVVDMSRTGGAPFGVLADYVALASLTQLDPFADMSREDTILNLFRDGSAVTGLTDWDKAYLAALYTSLTNRATDRQQVNDIVRRLTRGRGEAELRRQAEERADND